MTDQTEEDPAHNLNVLAALMEAEAPQEEEEEVEDDEEEDPEEHLTLAQLARQPGTATTAVQDFRIGR